ncbi:MAG TPA: type ISP restriction/modification enzyme, partial [Chloroflexia bacterium]
AVQYFYEPFLEAFDPQLRKDLGVWYTPPEIIKYMVERVDRVLREELGIDDGLADERVRVLDPACGTGAYLVEVLRRVAHTLKEEKGEDALLGYKVKMAATRRVFGFEILPAPFVVAHLQMGLLLQNLGAPLTEKANERAGIYLTNSLTGWEPGQGKPKQLALEGLEEEREAAQAVKRGDEILVVIGNPPYNAFAGTSPEQEQGLVEPYKEGLISKWGIKKFNLDDLYVRFFRLAERRITEMNRNRVGVVCYISNFSYLRDPSFVVMRQRFLNEFDALWFDSLNGDSRETGKVTPEGKPDPSVFSTPYNREGIRVGTAIGFMVRKRERTEKPVVKFRQFWGVNKREDLVASLNKNDFESTYDVVYPTKDNRFSFRVSDVSPAYSSWPRLIDLGDGVQYQGLAEDRRKALIDSDPAALEGRMRIYFNKDVDWKDLQRAGGPLTDSYVDFPAEEVRRKALLEESFDPVRIRRYAMRPFDTQYCYFTPIRPIWRRQRPEFYRQAWIGNAFIATRFKGAKDIEGPPISYITGLCDYHYLPPNVTAIPLQIRNSGPEAGVQQSLFAEPELTRANLSKQMREYLALLGLSNPDTNAEKARLVWMHALAIGYAPTYLEQNVDGIKQDWPRIPLPNSLEALERSAELGRVVAGLLDTDSPVRGITSGQVRPEMKRIGALQRANGTSLRPDEGDLNITAGWGHAGQEGVTMPGKGKAVERAYTAEEMAAIDEGARSLGLTLEQALRHLGETTLDVYLNNVAYWRNVPRRVWDYTIGGYQVMKKWLSYREMSVLGRGLKVEEAIEVRDMARRIAGIVLMEPLLNANYEAVKADAYKWQRDADTI